MHMEKMNPSFLVRSCVPFCCGQMEQQSALTRCDQPHYVFFCYFTSIYRTRIEPLLPASMDFSSEVMLPLSRSTQRPSHAICYFSDQGAMTHEDFAGHVGQMGPGDLQVSYLQIQLVALFV